MGGRHLYACYYKYKHARLSKERPIARVVGSKSSRKVKPLWSFVMPKKPTVYNRFSYAGRIIICEVVVRRLVVVGEVWDRMHFVR
jgi:hypothetical protein